MPPATRSTEIYNQVYKSAEPDPNTPVTPEVTTPPAEPPVAPPAAAAPPVEPPAPPPEAPKPVDWEAQTNNLKAAQGRLKRQISDQAQEIQQLKDMIEGMKAAPPAPMTPKPSLTDDEVATYGQEFLDVVGRKAREIAEPEIRVLKDQLSDLQKKLGHVDQSLVEDARSRMLADLDTSIPNWRLINNNKKFIEWLDFTDTYSGAIKHQLLLDAFAANQTARVKAFFQGFLDHEAATAPQPELTFAPQPATPAPTPKVPLETFAAPGRAKSSAPAPGPADEKPFITRAQISQFYVDCAAGKYRGREAEKRAAEQALQSAQAEGRILP
jgi:hypothetical protein